jgi:hypothetical protein
MVARAFALLLVSFFLIAPQVAAAQEVPVYVFGDPGCDYRASTFWADLAPGEGFSFELDLTACTTDMLGYYMLYGYLGTKSGVDRLEVGDGVVLTVEDLATNEVYTGGVDRKQDERVVLKIDGPTWLELSAENTSGKTVTIRLNWSHLIVADEPDEEPTSGGGSTSDNTNKGNGNGRGNGNGGNR